MEQAESFDGSSYSHERRSVTFTALFFWFGRESFLVRVRGLLLFWRVLALNLGDSTTQLVIQASENPAAMIVETMQRWRTIQVNLAITLTLTSRVQMLARAGQKTVRNRIPINRSEQFDGAPLA